MVFFDDGTPHPGHRPARMTEAGEYRREPTKFRGAPQPGEKLHLFVSRACPWAHRAALAVALKGLDIGVTSVLPRRDDDVGWAFAETEDAANGVAPDPVRGARLLSEYYVAADPHYTGNVTTPLLWSCDRNTVVSNESRDIVAALSAAFPDAGEPLPASGDEDWIHADLCLRVYHTGLARSQEAYDEGVAAVFAALGRAERLLAGRRFLGGAQLSQADVMLWPALVRFDEVYFTLFKCSTRRLASFRNLSGYLRDVWQTFPAARATTFFAHIAEHYYTTFSSLNPKQTVPLPFGVEQALGGAHDRLGLSAAGGDGDGDVAVAVAVPDTEQRRAAGEFVRGESQFRGAVDRERALAGSYVLIVANNCPWCHRCRLAVELKDLAAVVSVEQIHYRRDAERGWQIRPDDDAAAFGSRLGLPAGEFDGFIPTLYEREGSAERSVPVLWDRERRCIVNNESSDIVRQLNAAFPERGAAGDLYPAALRPQIDALNADVYTNINNGAYRAGFASSQEAYAAAATAYLAALERVDALLARGGGPFLLGDQLTEADLRLLPTALRHDHVYVTRMRLPVLIRDTHHHLYRWLRRLWAMPAVRAATDLEQCVLGYFGRTGNGIVPRGLTLSPAFP